ncbi:MAG TPA: HAD family hydrolase, partial [Kribbellaceae bacterium]|nr:HAD family hydrolase [Kribbellaceae bacterium]
LDALAEPHPGVDSETGTHRCGGWEASVARGQVRLSGEGDPYDGLRAILSAAWEASDAGRPVRVTAALEKAGLAAG